MATIETYQELAVDMYISAAESLGNAHHFLARRLRQRQDLLTERATKLGEVFGSDHETRLANGNYDMPEYFANQHALGRMVKLAGYGAGLLLSNELGSRRGPETPFIRLHDGYGTKVSPHEFTDNVWSPAYLTGVWAAEEFAPVMPRLDTV